MTVYAYNRRAFQEAAKLPNALVALYSSFVHLELALKACQPDFHQRRHDVCAMLEDFERVTELSMQLRNGLRALHCRSASGSTERMEHHNYPALRYLRHESDHASEQDTCDDVALRTLHGILEDIKLQLRKNKRIRPYL